MFEILMTLTFLSLTGSTFSKYSEFFLGAVYKGIYFTPFKTIGLTVRFVIGTNFYELI